MRKIIIWICILFLLVPFVLSVQPPTQVSINPTVGIEIKYPQNGFVKQNEDYDFYFHLFNKSDGLPITSANCTFHLYNTSGQHSYEVNVSTFTQVYDIEVNVAGANFSQLGSYSYIIQCVTPPIVQGGEEKIGGFDSVGFEVTKSGEEEIMEDTTSGISIVLFILAIAGSLFLLSMKKDILKNKYANIIVRRSLLVLGIYLMILNSAIMATLAASSNLPLVQEMFFYMKIIGWLGYPAIVFLMLSALFQTFNDMKMDKKNKRTGEEDEQ